MRTPAGIGLERTRIGCVGVGANSGGMSAKSTRVESSGAADGGMAKTWQGRNEVCSHFRGVALGIDVLAL